MKRTKRFLFLVLFLVSLFLPQLCLGTEKPGFESILAVDFSNSLSPSVSNRKFYQSGAEEIEIEEKKPVNFNQFIKNYRQIAGLFTVYRDDKKGKVYLEIKPEQLNKNYLATMTMESGIGESFLYSTIPLNDFLFYFKRTNNRLQFVVRNVNFRTSPGDPQTRSIARSFSDSILASIPIISIHPQRQSLLIDLENLLLEDLPDLNGMLREILNAEYSFDSQKSNFGAANVFPLNLEVDYNYGFSLSNEIGDNSYLRNLPDRRALNIRVHYSFSELTVNNGYVPRFADERVGYFTTVYQNFSNSDSKSPLVRYINRWHLEKQDPNAPLSIPKKPIVFWIENTVPLEYREAIREGILMWNKAFEKAGFKNAIEVQQMPDNATWSPADVRYNTIRWFASTESGLVALGPSRVNPLTGEILDADILINANIIHTLGQEYRTYINQKSSTSNKSNRDRICQPLPRHRFSYKVDYCYGKLIGQQFAIGSLALSLFQNTIPNNIDMKEYVHQYLRHVISHEVGHTLGLRHNFRGSTLLKPEELQDTDITRTKGMVSSVMDYVPVNLAPIGSKQGDYFPSTLGAYDEWAIEYGYKPSGMGNPQAEKQFLEKIAYQQNEEMELSYATDEDSIDLDPTVDTFDLSSDSLGYSQWQLDNARKIWERMNKSYPVASDNLGELREMFAQVLCNCSPQLRCGIANGGS